MVRDDVTLAVDHGSATPMLLLGVILTVLVLLAVVAAIVLFERPRARRIERDLRQEARRRADEDRDGPSP